jgi:hypothetical protein
MMMPPSRRIVKNRVNFEHTKQPLQIEWPNEQTPFSRRRKDQLQVSTGANGSQDLNDLTDSNDSYVEADFDYQGKRVETTEQQGGTYFPFYYT